MSSSFDLHSVLSLVFTGDPTWTPLPPFPPSPPPPDGLRAPQAQAFFSVCTDYCLSFSFACAFVAVKHQALRIEEQQGVKYETPSILARARRKTFPMKTSPFSRSARICARRSEKSDCLHTRSLPCVYHIYGIKIKITR